MAKFLLVDDAMFMRAAIKKMVEEAGHTVVAEAGNGMEAIEMYASSKPDMVLMDITMPDMDGIEATTRIMNADPNAKIVMVSAMGQMEMVVRAITAGAKDFVVKPVDSDKLRSCIKKYL
ncbi:MAG: response regulator [Lachnospiraceae bacterium]|nr:response regulator [Candidatus Colinaster scatohippi]